ncbi:hypothetical protein F3W84_06660 [Ochrobactrum quorumnocens]|uniref:Solute-binding protein family 5 domain-containing protein n=1 Tax=Ochrobactrum quorumnocens TaxID=271865 RepID=A0A5N1K110_9HYPH|nr:hypothetical protein F3W84_06660 [[Ochrobactrum] quorumnocens]
MVREILLTGVCLVSLGSASSAAIVLNRGNDMDPSTLDQQLTTTIQEYRVLKDLYEGLVAQEVWRGTMLPASSMVPPGINNYVKDGPQLSYAKEDILDREEKAKKLLADAGVTPGSLSIVLKYSTSENHKNTMAAIADMLKDIGINATLDEVDGTTYFNYLEQKGMFDIARDGWVGDYNDPNSFLSLFASDSYFNYAQWSNKDYDALMMKSATTADLGERAKILTNAEEILLQDGAAIPLLYYSSTALVADKVKGYDDNLMNSHATHWLSIKG